MKLSKGALLLGAAFTVFSFFSTPSIACSSNTGNLTLEQKCWTDLFQVRPVALSEAIGFDVLRLRQGYENTLVLHPSTRLQGLSYSISPSLSYDQNINGGNPDKPLVINGLSFIGQDEFKAESGWLVGLNAGVSYSQPFSEGSYISAALNLFYGFDPDSDLEVQRYGFNICSNSQFDDEWFSKGCLSQSGSERELSSSRTQVVSLEAGKAISLGLNSQIAPSLQLQRMFTFDYIQNVYGLQVDWIRNFAPSTLFAFQKGEGVDGEHALDYSISVRQNIPIAGRGYSVQLSRSVYDGSMLFGVAREDVNTSVSVSTMLRQVGSLTLGFSKTDSTIDYYDASNPTFSLGFEALF